MTREQWLNALIKKLRPIVAAKHSGDFTDKLRISCGYPTSGNRTNTIGECIYPQSSADGHTEVFVRPDIADPVHVADIVVHELCHAALGPGYAHGPVFRKLATAVGLTGKMKATVAGPDLRAKLEEIVARLGPYPHAALVVTKRGRSSVAKGNKAQKNVTCPLCGFRAKVYTDQLSMGRARCPDGDPMRFKGEEIEGDEE